MQQIQSNFQDKETVAMISHHQTPSMKQQQDTSKMQ